MASSAATARPLGRARAPQRSTARGLAAVVAAALGAALFAATADAAAPPIEAFAHGLPLGLLLAALSITARYPCRATPLATTGPLRLLVTHATAALTVAAAWVGGGRLLARGLDAAGITSGGDDRLAARATLLLVVGLLGYLLAVALTYLAIAADAARRAELRAAEARALARESELAALRRQVSPHFLFNCLNTISSLAGRDAAAARRACSELAALLRRTLKASDRDLVTLDEELALVDAFLALERLRFGTRLGTRLEIDPDARGGQLPALSLLTLAENAVTHGIASSLDGGEIAILARAGDGTLELEVCNPRDGDATSRRGTGSGLGDLERRLRAIYGSAARLEVSPQATAFRVRLRVPQVAPTTTGGAG